MNHKLCNKWLRKNSDSWPRTCRECGLSGNCKHYIEVQVDRSDDGDMQAAKQILDRGYQEMALEIRKSPKDIEKSKWYILCMSILDCWPELEKK